MVIRFYNRGLTCIDTLTSVTPLRHSFLEFFPELIQVFASSFFPGRVVSCVESTVRSAVRSLPARLIYFTLLLQGAIRNQIRTVVRLIVRFRLNWHVV